jgi:two-component system, OmpR family, phosphate regulon sensor histidine kinase PhoR
VGSGTSSIPTRSKRRLVLQLLVPAVAALAGALVLEVPYVSVTLERHQTDTLAERLLAEARLAAEALPWQSGGPLDVACARLASELGARITVIAPDGHVLGESTRSSDSLENHADRPEIRAALATGSGRASRFSTTVGMRLLYTAWRQDRSGDTRIVRVAVPLTAVAAGVSHVRRLILAGLAVGALLGLGAGLAMSRRLLRRIRRLVEFARTVAAGAPAPYLAHERDDDLGVLEDQLAVMARAVSTTLDTQRVERERLEALLRGMVEGVVVTDLGGTVALMNDRARELLDVPPGLDGSGHALIELARQPQLGEILRELAAGTPTLSRDVTLAEPEGPTLQVNGARLVGPDGSRFGVVLVLHDVTELRRLEVVRRDFVANVSHELRTPLTAIKGYAETLLGTAGNDADTRRRFLTVIDRHSERLGRLIDDLLTLSDLELGRSPLRLGTVSVAAAVDDVLQILADAAARAGVDLSAAVEPDTPRIEVDADRFRQVLINLVDNAVKYTPGGGRVSVRAGRARTDGMVEVSIEDTGIGIPAHALPRLTERFFRVDKGRSRALGGTGLGLAIVKHIVQAHGGDLDIASAVGRGTTVRVYFSAAVRRPATAAS